MATKKHIHDYVVVLKNTNLSIIKKTSILLMLLVVIMYAIELYLYPHQLGTWIFISIIALLILGSFFDKKKKITVSYSFILIISGIALMSSTLYPIYIGLLFIAAGILEKYFVAKKELGFTKDGIEENGLMHKKIQWNELTNVLIKDGLLTMDFKNNKLIQLETDDEEDDDYEVDEEEFNSYCRKHLLQ